jgi:hypothetical protein
VAGGTIGTWTSTTRRLRFRRDDTDSEDVLSGTGQLVAVIADPRRTDHDDTIAISRTGVEFADVEQALEGWQHWATLGEEAVNLTEIQRRIHAVGLDWPLTNHTAIG